MIVLESIVPFEKGNSFKFKACLRLGQAIMDAALDAKDLLTYSSFQLAILAKCGVLYRDPVIERMRRKEANLAWRGYVDRTTAAWRAAALNN